MFIAFSHPGSPPRAPPGPLAPGPRPRGLAGAPSESEKGKVLPRGVGTLRYLLPTECLCAVAA